MLSRPFRAQIQNRPIQGRRTRRLPLATPPSPLRGELDCSQHVLNSSPHVSDRSNDILTAVMANAAMADQRADALGAIRQLDAIVPNTFQDDPARLAVWTTARHVERAPRTKKSTTGPANAVLDNIETGLTLEEFIDNFPTVTREQALQVLEFSSRRHHRN